MEAPIQIVSDALRAEFDSLIQDRKKPSLDKYRNSFRVDSFDVSNSPSFDELAFIIEKMAEPTLPKQSTYAQSVMRQWHIIMANLCHATAANKWVGISGYKRQYTAGGYLSQLGLTYAATERILNRLMDGKLIVKEQGKKYQGTPITNQYYPTKELQGYLAEHAFFADNPTSFDRPFLAIGMPTAQYQGFSWSDDHPDRLMLNEINEFARTQTWACKGAIRQTFKHTPFQSGRLTTPFQNLQSRSYDIRRRTLINGRPLVEVDFNANHLRLFLAMHQTKVIGGSDAYAPFVEETGIARDKVKAFINISLNEADESKAQGAAAFNKPFVRHDEFERLKQAFSKLYPKLNLHANFALPAMQVEGLILRNVLHKGASEGILALPVHDAVAVEAEHAEWAVQAMTDAWEQAVHQWHPSAKSSVKAE